MANATGFRRTTTVDGEFSLILQEMESFGRHFQLTHGEVREHHGGLGGRSNARQQRQRVVEMERSRRRLLALQRSSSDHPETDLVIGGSVNNMIRTWNEEKEDSDNAREEHHRTWPDIVKKARERVALADARKAAKEAEASEKALAMLKANEEKTKAEKAERKKKRSKRGSNPAQGDGSAGH